MIDDNLVKISPFNLVGKDERGITAEFSLPRMQSNFVYITRAANSMSGNTYHEGKVVNTNPKIFILLSGQIKLSYRKIDQENIHSQIIDFPAIIEIKPFVTHSVIAKTDIFLLECNSIADIQQDRIREEV